MSNDKHTPGPWEALGNIVRSPMYQPEGLPRGVIIAECRDGYYLPHTDEAKANARLIAAAPELLEALVAAEDRDEEKQSFAEVERLYKSAGTAIKSEFDYEFYRRTKQRAAIAKATGSDAD